MKIQFTQKETAALKALKEQLYTLKNTVSTLFGKKGKYQKPNKFSEFNKNGVVSMSEKRTNSIKKRLSGHLDGINNVGLKNYGKVDTLFFTYLNAF